MGILSNHTEPKCNGELFEFTFTAFPRAHLNTPTYAEIFHLHNLVVGRIKASHTMKESYLSNIIDGQFPREKYIYIDLTITPTVNSTLAYMSGSLLCRDAQNRNQPNQSKSSKSV